LGYREKLILTDKQGNPIPQVWDPVLGDFVPHMGKVQLSGAVVSPATDAKLEQVKSELELVKSELETIKANQLSGDQKVQLSGAVVSPATDAKLEQVKSELELVKSELETIKANQLSGDQKAQLSGQIALGDEQVTVEEDDVKSLSPPQGATVAYITVSDGAVRYRIGADPTGTLGHRANGDDDIVLASAEDIAAFRVTNNVDQSYSTIFVTYSGAVS